MQALKRNWKPQTAGLIALLLAVAAVVIFSPSDTTPRLAPLGSTADADDQAKDRSDDVGAEGPGAVTDEDNDPNPGSRGPDRLYDENQMFIGGGPNTPPIPLNPGEPVPEHVKDRLKADVEKRMKDREKIPGVDRPVREINEELHTAIVDGGKPVETTSDHLYMFEGDLRFLFGQEDVTVSKDECLSEWAVSALTSFDGKSFVGVMDVCGSPAAVTVGWWETSTKDFTFRAFKIPGYEHMRPLLSEPNLVFASSATDNGGAVLFVAQPAR